MPRFTGVDFYEIDSLLTDEEKQIRDHVRDWVEDRYLPHVEAAYEEGVFPMDVIPEVAEMGLLGATLPEKYGCAGVNPTYGLAMQELERGDSDLRSFTSVRARSRCPSTPRLRGAAPKVAAEDGEGRSDHCFGLTGPDFGSNPAGMITRGEERRRVRPRQRQDVDHERHDRASRGGVGETQERIDRQEEIRGFLVEQGMKGFSAPERNASTAYASVTGD
jgi:glutaryl-CoA dehydrogenase